MERVCKPATIILNKHVYDGLVERGKRGAKDLEWRDIPIKWDSRNSCLETYDKSILFERDDE